MKINGAIIFVLLVLTITFFALVANNSKDRENISQLFASDNYIVYYLGSLTIGNDNPHPIELNTKQRETFLYYLRKSISIPPPSAGSLYSVYYFKLYDEQENTRKKVWDIEVKINKLNDTCRVRVSSFFFAKSYFELDHDNTVQLEILISELEDAIGS